jgi:uncharacterized protein with HEPN domain
MPLDVRDLARLVDIEIYAQRALDYLASIKPDDDGEHGSTMTQDAILRCFEIIGEAARATTPEGKAAYPALPWPFMVGMRNRLIHEYRRVDLNVVYATIRQDLPGLLVLVREILAEHNKEEI